MKFESVELYNFKVFTGRQLFNFCHGLPGLHFITGKNLVDKNLDANGVGKSSLWDAISWVLYGRTLRGARASNVCSWQVGSGCEVTLKLVVDDKSNVIFRSWSPNKLTLNDEVCEQDKIDNLIKVSFEAFQHSIILGQFSPMFFDQKPAEKLGLFSGVLALDYWNQKSVEATQVVSEIDAEISSIELSISNYDHVIGSQKEQLDRLKKLNVSFITDKKNKLKVIKSDKQENQDDIVKLDLNIAEIGGEIDSILEDIKSVKQDLVKTEEQWKEADKKLAASQAEVQFLKAIYSERKSAFYDFTKLEEKKCPTCYAPVTREHYQKILTDLQKQVSELDQSLRKALDKAKLDGDRAGKLYKKCKVYSDKKSEKDALLLSRSNELDRIGMTRNNLIKRNAALDEEAAALSSEENVFAAEIKDLRANMKEVSGKKKAARDTIKELQAEKAAASYWVKGFKEIRLFLIEEALTLLEVEVNNNLLQLGLRNWKIEFDVERETKSGTISKGFQVFIKSPYNKEPVPWESWSGGESQRLRLAGNLGLSSLICAKLGIQSNILVLDEPTQHLTPGGVEDLLNFLENKARTENRQIWMIDHNALDYGGFTSVTQIVKSSAGSSINIEVRDGE